MEQVRKRKPKTQWDKDLKRFRKTSDKHVLVIETTLTDMNDIRIISDEADRVRKAGNELVGEMEKRYEQLMRTKRYRKLISLYGKAKRSEDDEKQKVIAQELNAMQQEYNVT